MASRIWINIIKVFSSILLFTQCSNTARACMFSEEPEIYRIAMFRAEIEGMSSFSQFYYSADFLPEYFSNPHSYDRKQNCNEWQKELNGKPLIRDVYAILYKVPPDMFVYACEEKMLDDVFEGNTFIEELLKPSNKNLLNYLLLAKVAEYHELYDFDSWHTGKFIDDCEFTGKLIYRLNSTFIEEKSKFLQKRYAYQLSRLYCETGDFDKCISLYDAYFKNQQDSTILEPWTLLYKALSLDEMGDKTEANFLYCQVFARSDEKKLRCYLGFNSGKNAYDSTLLLAKTNAEKIAVIALSCFHNPGPALDKLKEIFALDPSSKFLAPLVMRELNKLEDWIVTPSLTSESPTVRYDTSYYEYYYKSEEKWEEAKKQNMYKDKIYLGKFLTFLSGMYTTSKGEFHDFLAVALAHLYLIDDKPVQSSAYLTAVSVNASKSVLFQKYVDGLLISINSRNLNDNKVKENIGQQLVYLQKSAHENFSIYKTLYSIVLKLSHRYELYGNYAMAGLLKNKSDNLKYFYDSESEYGWMYSYYDEASYSYSDIAYFDEKAKPSDMDSVLRIITKPASSLDQFVCSQKLASVYAYKDLKGTLAFRMDSLHLAFKTFSEIPDTFYKKEYEFKNYLNEDPFIPKCWPHTRNFYYDFNKAKFVKRLIDLKKDAIANKSKSAWDYLKLADAYFNCTYWGNSWMMFSYGWSIYPNSFYGWELYPFVDFSKNNSYQKAYYECSRAMDYYTRALKASKNTEYNAKALFMLYVCDQSAYYYRGKGYSWEASPDLMKKYSSSYLKDLCLKYSNTKAFRELSSNCSTIYDYAEQLGVKLY